MKRIRLEIERPGCDETLVMHINDPGPDVLKTARAVLKTGARIKQATFLTYTAPKEERLL